MRATCKPSGATETGALLITRAGGHVNDASQQSPGSASRRNRSDLHRRSIKPFPSPSAQSISRRTHARERERRRREGKLGDNGRTRELPDATTGASHAWFFFLACLALPCLCLALVQKHPHAHWGTRNLASRISPRPTPDPRPFSYPLLLLTPYMLD